MNKTDVGLSKEFGVGILASSLPSNTQIYANFDWTPILYYGGIPVAVILTLTIFMKVQFEWITKFAQTLLKNKSS